ALVIEKGIIPRNKLLADVKEAENHFNVFMEMLKEKRISLRNVLEWHYKLFKDTKKDIAGKIRKHQVRISGSKFVPPTPAGLNALLSEFFRWLNRSLNRVHPVEVAGLAHLKFVTIHPFADGNGRVSRLLMNWILWRKNYPMFIIEYRNRARYYSALERAQTKKNEFIFLGWFIKEYKKYIERELKC
ncbi:MAG TPA: Fic family protein, partial [Candidatus Woesearchaeota archaeon]|nr:Fic family protein [Candidatus Woesearchaeota archaeon]